MAKNSLVVGVTFNDAGPNMIPVFQFFMQGKIIDL